MYISMINPDPRNNLDMDIERTICVMFKGVLHKITYILCIMFKTRNAFGFGQKQPAAIYKVLHWGERQIHADTFGGIGPVPLSLDI